MRNFDTFNISVIMSKYESIFKARASDALQKALAFKELKNISDLVIWAKDSTDQSPIKYNIGSFFCRNASAYSLTETMQLNGMLRSTKIDGFIINIPKSKVITESLKFIKDIGLVIDYAITDNFVNIYCFGGNSVGLIVGLLRDFTILTQENALEKVRIYPEFHLFLEVRMGTENLKDVSTLSMDVLNFLSRTNHNNQSIHNSWREYLGEMQPKTLQSYLLYVKKIAGNCSLDITYKKRMIEDLDSHILFNEKFLENGK